jgi:hypothetical protein
MRADGQAVESEIPMRCDFEKICSLLDGKLGIGQRLEVLDHLENCDICFETARMIKRDRDAELYVRLKVTDEPGSRRAEDGLVGIGNKRRPFTRGHPGAKRAKLSMVHAR